MRLKPSMQSIQSELVLNETRLGIERTSWQHLLTTCFEWTSEYGWPGGTPKSWVRWPGGRNVVGPGWPGVREVKLATWPYGKKSLPVPATSVVVATAVATAAAPVVAASASRQKKLESFQRPVVHA